MFAIRIPDSMRRDMARVKINWSDYLRQSINEALESEKKRTWFQKLHALTRGKKRTRFGTAVKMLRQIRDHG